MPTSSRPIIDDDPPEDCAFEVSLGDKIAFLLTPGAYRPAPAEVDAEETHMSWVFLAGDRVFKLKKPVCYPFLDFSTLERREWHCREEVRLNRRLAPEIYLGIVPLTVDDAGQLALAGTGHVVDWLVEMRRLPRERMLDAAIRGDRVTRAEVDAIGRLLAEFHTAQPPAAVEPDTYVTQFAREQMDNRAVLCDPALGLAPGEAASALNAVDAVIEGDPDLLRARVEEGRVVDGHGDLRPEHVCLCTPPVVIDCLEFNHVLRLVDPIDELISLGLDCERLGADWIGPALLASAAPRFTAGVTPALLRFYRAYRACVRARLALVHLREPDVRRREEWLPRTRRYLALATTLDVTAYLPKAR